MCSEVQAGTITWSYPGVFNQFQKNKIREMITDEYPSKESQCPRLLTESKPYQTPPASQFPSALTFYNFSLPVDEVRSKHTGAC